MEGWTLGQSAATIGLLAGLITGFGVITKLVGRTASKWLTANLKPILDKLDTIDRRLDAFDEDRCKDYIVVFLAKIDNGHQPSETELERFYENYDRYTGLGGNSYVKTEVQRLSAAGKLRRA